MTRWTPLAALALSGCMVGTVDPGTAVGNPPDALVRLAPSEAVSVSEASLTNAALLLAPCNTAEPVEEYPLGTLDLLASSAFEIDGFELCGARIEGDGLSMTVSTTGSDPVSIAFASIELDLGPADAANPPTLETDAHYILELAGPDWLDVLEDPLLEGDPDVAAGSTLHNDLVASIEDDTTLVEDVDNDGSIDDSERANSEVDASNPPVREADDD